MEVNVDVAEGSGQALTPGGNAAPAPATGSIGAPETAPAGVSGNVSGDASAVAAGS